jgi:thiamine-phosphate pyrophosphorylase
LPERGQWKRDLGKGGVSEARCRLYLITPPRIEPKTFAETLKRALDGGDVASLQLRLKDVSDEEILRAGERLMPVHNAPALRSS